MHMPGERFKNTKVAMENAEFYKSNHILEQRDPLCTGFNVMVYARLIKDAALVE